MRILLIAVAVCVVVSAGFCCAADFDTSADFNTSAVHEWTTAPTTRVPNTTVAAEVAEEEKEIILLPEVRAPVNVQSSSTWSFTNAAVLVSIVIGLLTLPRLVRVSEHGTGESRANAPTKRDSLTQAVALVNAGASNGGTSGEHALLFLRACQQLKEECSMHEALLKQLAWANPHGKKALETELREAKAILRRHLPSAKTYVMNQILDTGTELENTAEAASTLSKDLCSAFQDNLPHRVTREGEAKIRSTLFGIERQMNKAHDLTIFADGLFEEPYADRMRLLSAYAKAKIDMLQFVSGEKSAPVNLPKTVATFSFNASDWESSMKQLNSLRSAFSGSLSSYHLDGSSGNRVAVLKNFATLRFASDRVEEEMEKNLTNPTALHRSLQGARRVLNVNLEKVESLLNDWVSDVTNVLDGKAGELAGISKKLLDSPADQKEEMDAVEAIRTTEEILREGRLIATAYFSAGEGTFFMRALLNAEAENKRLVDALRWSRDMEPLLRKGLRLKVAGAGAGALGLLLAGCAFVGHRSRQSTRGRGGPAARLQAFCADLFGSGSPNELTLHPRELDLPKAHAELDPITDTTSTPYQDGWLSETT